MDDANEPMQPDCGCDCELCRAGKHHECHSGMCRLNEEKEPMEPED